MASREGKTYIGAILFLDVVGFSNLANSDQIAVKKLFDSLLLDAIDSVPPEGFVVLDTGDGAILCFHDPPELALLTAVTLRQSWRAKAPVGLRMGLHLGPVQEVRDMNNNRNVLGDGINTAQRIISFAKNGEITASGQYRDALYHVHAQFARMFTEPVARADKHGRSHPVCFVIATEEQEIWSQRTLRALFLPAQSTHQDRGAKLPRSAATSTEGGSPSIRTWNARSLTVLGAGVVGFAAVAAYFVVLRPQFGAMHEESSARVGSGQLGAQERPKLDNASSGRGTPAIEAPRNGTARDGPPDATPAIKVRGPDSSMPTAPTKEERSDSTAQTRLAPSLPEQRPSKRAAPSALDTPTGLPPRLQSSLQQSPRCLILLEKISLGEPLSGAEQREFRSQCR